MEPYHAFKILRRVWWKHIASKNSKNMSKWFHLVKLSFLVIYGTSFIAKDLQAKYYFDHKKLFNFKYLLTYIFAAIPKWTSKPCLSRGWTSKKHFKLKMSLACRKWPSKRHFKRYLLQILFYSFSHQRFWIFIFQQHFYFYNWSLNFL